MPAIGTLPGDVIVTPARRVSRTEYPARPAQMARVRARPGAARPLPGGVPALIAPQPREPDLSDGTPIDAHPDRLALMQVMARRQSFGDGRTRRSPIRLQRPEDLCVLRRARPPLGLGAPGPGKPGRTQIIRAVDDPEIHLPRVLGDVARHGVPAHPARCEVRRLTAGASVGVGNKKNPRVIGRGAHLPGPDYFLRVDVPGPEQGPARRFEGGARGDLQPVARLRQRAVFTRQKVLIDPDLLIAKAHHGRPSLPVDIQHDGHLKIPCFRHARRMPVNRYPVLVKDP